MPVRRKRADEMPEKTGGDFGVDCAPALIRSSSDVTLIIILWKGGIVSVRSL